ncbi:MAG: hypothetical protein JXA68_09195 [Ignavibacteriales bacterium]|nr:hypothetical protein [Ignavibacteriales bacterium]
MKKNLIPGIYNYCDMWCEQCKYTTQCLVFQKEKERRIKHLENDEDPDDINSVLEDVKESFQEAFMLIKEQKGELEIETEDVGESKFITAPDFTKYNIHSIGNEYFSRGIELLESLSKYYSLIVLCCDGEDVVYDEDSLDIKNNIQILSYYTHQVFSKIRRLIMELEDKVMDEYLLEARNITAKIIYIALTRSSEALGYFYQLENGFEEEIEEMLLLTNKVKDELLSLVPDVENYKRKYFD